MLQIYKASAGSGKTYNLTREYIKFLIATKGKDGRYRLRSHPSSDHSHLLAVTFTNKATNEMTRRIIKELAMLAGMSTPEDLAGHQLNGNNPDEITLLSPYAKDFLDTETGLDCTVEQLRTTSRKALINLLFDYSYFNVGTIDSFFQTVLRMFTREVEIPDNYNIELNNSYAISLGVDEMYMSLNYHTIPDTPEDVEKRWVKNWLLQFMRSNMVSGGAFNIFSRSSQLYGKLIRSIELIVNEEFKMRLSTLRPYLADKKRIVRFASDIERIMSDVSDRLAKGAATLLSHAEPGYFDHNFYNAMVKLSDGVALSSDRSVTKVVNNPAAASTAKAIKKYGLTDNFLQECRQVAVYYDEHKRLWSILKPIYQQIYIFGLLSTVLGKIEEYCRKNALILLSETNNILSDLINDDETPFIYEKLGYYLDHFLIDEFQDTSPMQWENLRPLVTESLSRNMDNLIIGDEKQCIYRFRNSDPQLLGQDVETYIVRRFATRDAVNLRGVEIRDNSNWRSSEEIVKFNNSLFMTLAGIVDAEHDTVPGALSATATYSNIIQQIDPKRNAGHGYVKIVFGEKNDEEEGGGEVSGTPTPLSFVATEITRLLNSGYKPGDIAILVRDHKNGQNVISFLLSLMNMPGSPLPRFDIISEDAMGLEANQSIRLIISILRLVSMPEFLEVDCKLSEDGESDPDEDHKKPKASRSEAYRRARLINRYHFYRHITHPDGTTFTASEALNGALVDNRTLGEDEQQDIIKQEMSSLLDMDCLNIYTVIERIIDRFVPAQLKELDNLFLTTFQDLVLDYTERAGHDIKGFLNWWDKSGCKCTITSPAGANALTVMTIHKAKGLEFPCVIIPFASGEMFKNGTTAWIDLPQAPFVELGFDADDIPPAMPLSVTTTMAELPIYGNQCLNVIRQACVDELNVNYVALTRPTTELLVFVPKKQSRSFAEYLREGLKKLTPEYVKNLPVDDISRQWLIPLANYFKGNCFELGEPTVKQEKKNLETTCDNTAPATTEDKPLIEVAEINDYVAGRFLDHKRACTIPEIHVPFNPDDQRHRGNFLHAVMSKVTDRSRLEYALNLMAYRYHLDAAQIESMRHRLRQALANPEASRWFEDYERIITERTVTARGDIRRPDRVVYNHDGTIDVVDYKFVDRIPEQLDGNRQHVKYASTVSRYCRYIKGNTHAPAVNGYIWYISPDSNVIKKI